MHWIINKLNTTWSWTDLSEIQIGNLTSKEFFFGISFQNFHSFTKEPLSLSSSWKEIISVMSSVDRPLSSIKVKCRKNFNCVKVRYRLEANQLSLQREMSKVTFSWNNTCTKFIWLFGLESPNLSTIYQLCIDDKSQNS